MPRLRSRAGAAALSAIDPGGPARYAGRVSTDIQQRLAGRIEEAVAQLDSLAEAMLNVGRNEEAMVLINQILLMNPPNADQYRQLLMQLQQG